MTPVKPYLIRAIYEWILDNDTTPYIVAVTTSPQVIVPKKFCNDDKITLNISPTATHNLRIGNDVLECKARFAGVSYDIYVPIEYIIAIYANENNQGMMFPAETAPAESMATTNATASSMPPKKPTKPKLSVIDGGK